MRLRHRSGDGRGVWRRTIFGGNAATTAVVDGAAAAEPASAGDERELRHAALLDSIVTTIPAALRLARTRGWDEGWEAARHGLPKSSNPVRSAD